MLEDRTPRPDGTAVDACAAVVVVNFRSHHLLESNLASLDQARLVSHVVIVDSFHSAAERDAVRQVVQRRGWELVALETNPGFGAGVNAGAAHALALGVDVLVLLNPDASIRPDALDVLVRDCADQPSAVLCPRIERPDGSTWFDGGAIHLDRGLAPVREPSASATQAWLTGACLVIHADMWSRLGGFDEDYFMYWEDVDLSYRCTRIGGELVVRSDVTAVHSVGASQKSDGGGKSNLYYRYNCRNRLLFAAKNLSGGQLRTSLRVTPAFALEVLLRGGRRQFLRHPIGPVWAAVRGSAEGYAAVRARARTRA